MGLGVGFFLAGLVFLAWHPGPTREEIIARAREYGMVFREEVVPLVQPPGKEGGQSQAGTPGTAPAGPPQQPGANPGQGNTPPDQGATAATAAATPAHTGSAAGSSAAKAATGPAGEILVTIPAGVGLEDIAAALEAKGVISAATFEAEVHREGLGGKIKAGSYYLPPGDVQEIIKRLTS
ncbi:hypothetical protein SDD30_01175 [Moorella naiadis]|uniref:hypothetical protein n=1 Tax=Moorella naiadis (nom. illeg.) TaxID=3093670 RepID=UPI003D9CB118